MTTDRTKTKLPAALPLNHRSKDDDTHPSVVSPDHRKVNSYWIARLVLGHLRVLRSETLEDAKRESFAQIADITSTVHGNKNVEASLRRKWLDSALRAVGIKKEGSE